MSSVCVRPGTGLWYEFAKAILGTFIGSLEGTASRMNATLVNGSKQLREGSWVEVAGVLSDRSGKRACRLWKGENREGGGGGELVEELNRRVFFWRVERDDEE